MSLLTDFLKLFKWNTSDEADLEEEFDIDISMNENWDKLDANAKTVNQNISELQEAQTKQDTQIKELQDRLQQTQNALINETTDEATSLHVENAAELPAILSVRGNHRQEGTSTPDAPVEVETVGDNVNLASIENGNIRDADGINFFETNCIRTNYIEFNKNKKLTISFPTNFETNYRNYYLYDKNKFFIKTYYGYNDKQVITTNLENVAYIRFKMNGPTGGSVTVDDFSNFKVEEGSVVTPYSPYGMGSVEITKENGDKTLSEIYNLPIQQPMLSGDYFVKEADGWKEVHGWDKYIFDGTENYKKSDSYSDDNWFCGYVNNSLTSTILEDGKMVTTRYNNIGIYSGITNENCIACRGQFHVRISTEFLTENTAEAYKSLLAQWYDEGKPLIAYYQLITPTKLPCTEAQSAVLDQLNELPMFKGTNNIITSDNLALLQMTYTLDTKSYIDSKLGGES